MDKGARLSLVVAMTIISSTTYRVAYSQDGGPASALTSVSVTKAFRKDIKPSIFFSGHVEVKDKVELHARVTGVLERRFFTEGQDVKTGDLLFTVETGQYQAGVSKAEGNIVSSKAVLALANIEAGRQSILVAKNAAPQSQLDVAIANQRAARGNLKQDLATLKKAKLDLGYTDIRAPIDGRIGRSQYSAGSYIGTSNSVLATIVTQDPINVTFSVSQREILAIRETLGAKGTLAETLDAAIVQLQLADGKQYGAVGKVTFIDVMADKGSDTVRVRASFPNPDRNLTDGQLVKVIVEGRRPQSAVLISQSAILIDRAGPYALVVNTQNKIEVRRIEPGRMEGNDVSVVSGLVEGDMIVTEGIQKVRPGQLVDPTEVMRAL